MGSVVQPNRDDQQAVSPSSWGIPRGSTCHPAHLPPPPSPLGVSLPASIPPLPAKRLDANARGVTLPSEAREVAAEPPAVFEIQPLGVEVQR